MGTFPTLQRLIKRWLKAGVIDNGVFHETEQGAQQDRCSHRYWRT
jgi:hypothetical protein